MIDRHGVEATRLHVLYKAPPEDELLWSEDGINGLKRWTKRCTSLLETVMVRPTREADSGDSAISELQRALIQTQSEVPIVHVDLN